MVTGFPVPVYSSCCFCGGVWSQTSCACAPSFRPGVSGTATLAHQKEAGVFAAVSGLVDQLSDNPAAKLTAVEIMERVQRAVGVAKAA